MEPDQETAAAGDTIGERFYTGVRTVHDGYDAIMGQIRRFTSAAVGKVEILIGLALYAGLVYWVYLLSLE